MTTPRKPTNSAIYNYLKANPNIIVYPSALARELELHDGSVGTALARMASIPDYHVYHGPARGEYIYRPNGPNADMPIAETPKPREPVSAYPAKIRANVDYGKGKRTYEFVGYIDGNSIMVRDEAEMLYVVIPVKEWLVEH